MRPITACLQAFFSSVLTVALFANSAVAQTTSFTYQGKLTDGSNPANGSYDLQFALFDSLSGGSQIGSTLTRAATAVSSGIFTVQLDFGVSAFPGADRFLEIGVRSAGAGSFTILTPRQQISSTPYAIRTLNAATADTATNATQLGGVAASQYVQTNDSRLSDARPPTAGSANYIQNATAPQAADFNITGNGTVGSKVGIGTTNPLARLQVASGGETLNSYTARFQSSPNVAGAGGILFDQNSTFGWKMHTEGTGDFNNGSLLFSPVRISDGSVVGDLPTLVLSARSRVGINTIPTAALDVNGTVRIRAMAFAPSNGSVCRSIDGDLVICGSSSLRFKSNIAQFNSGLDIVRRLRPVSFDWKDGSGHDIGLVAEDVAKVAPSFIFNDNKGELVGIKYERLNMLLINAINEQQKQIEQLRTQLRRLRSIRRAHPPRK